MFVFLVANGMFTTERQTCILTEASALLCIQEGSFLLLESDMCVIMSRLKLKHDDCGLSGALNLV